MTQILLLAKLFVFHAVLARTNVTVYITAAWERDTAGKGGPDDDILIHSCIDHFLC
jgi:hypothetical protein